MNGEDKIYLGLEAQRLQNDDALQAIFHRIEREAIEDAMKLATKAGPENEELRRVALLRAQAIRDVRQTFTDLIMTGKQAAKRAGKD